MSTRSALLVIAFSAAAGSAAAADGLAQPDSHAIWPQWQARITDSTTQLAPVSLTERSDAALTSHTSIPSSALLGDYYFDAPGLRLPSSVGGLRATSGLVITTPKTLLSQPGPADGVPYLGLGYTGLALKGGWGFTADFGLTMENAGGVGQALFGNQGFDSALRDLRLSPVLQVGVRYAF